jgi:hypothetical protein
MSQYKASTFSQLIFYHFQVSHALSVKLCDKETEKVYFKKKRHAAGRYTTESPEKTEDDKK